MRNNKQAKKDHPSLNVSKRSRTSPILPFQNMDKLKINNRLAAAGFKNMKVGKMGYEVIFNKLYRHFGYQTLENAWELIYSFGSNFLPW